MGPCSTNEMRHEFTITFNTLWRLLAISIYYEESQPMKALLKFWGVRGSLSAGNSSFGSHTSCTELQINKSKSFFFDAGTGIKFASKNRKFERAYLYLSHFHWDHIQGLPFFEALFDQDCEIEIITAFDDCIERLKVLFDTRFHPVPFETYEDKLKVTIAKPGESLEREGLKLEFGALNHPGGCYAIKVSSNQGSLVFATDTDFDPMSPEASRLLQHADVAVLDSQYLLGDALKKAHFGHASFKTAIDVATNNFVKRLYLYSLDMNYSDEELKSMEAQAKDYVSSVYGDSGSEVEMAREGFQQEIVF